MKFQKDSYSCGAAALSNALKCLGENVSERRVRVYSNTTEKDGTSEGGIAYAAEQLGFGAKVFVTVKSRGAWNWLEETLRSGVPVVVCMTNGSHWGTAVGMLGNRVVVFDPGKFVYNLKENGVRLFSKRVFMKIWEDSKNNDFMGIAISKKTKGPGTIPRA